MPDDPAPLGLLLPGGGARCAYQAGALKAIAEMTPRGRNPFAVIAGQSAGAINAARLAAGARNFRRAAHRLELSWANLTIDHVVRTDALSVGGRGLLWLLMAMSGGYLVRNPISLLDNAPLRELLTREIDFAAIGTAIRRGDLAAVGLSASSYAEASGQAVTFFDAENDIPEWTRVRRIGIRRSLGIEHVMASTALPFMFPAQKIEGGYYGDGALRLTSPLSPAIRLGARRLLIIAARDPEVTAPSFTSSQDYPSLGTLVGHMLDIVFNDFLDTDIERLERINNTLTLLGPEKAAQTPLNTVEAFVLRPSVDLREIARVHARSLPWTIRMLLRGIGGWGGDWRLPSYLNFNPGYCRALIDLGHKDAWAHERQLRELLRLPR